MKHGKRPAPRGAAMVEMALILPVFVILIFGVMEYGWVFLRVSQLNNAARQGARIAARPDADVAEVQSAVAQVMNQAGIGASLYELTITDLNAAVGNPVTVKVKVLYENVELIGFALIGLPTQISGAASMAKEGPS